MLPAAGPNSAPASSGPPNCSMSLQLAQVYAFARRHGRITTIRSGPNDTTMRLYFVREPEAADKI